MRGRMHMCMHLDRYGKKQAACSGGSSSSMAWPTERQRGARLAVLGTRGEHRRADEQQDAAARERGALCVAGDSFHA